jgi:hypothetical protein
MQIHSSKLLLLSRQLHSRLGVHWNSPLGLWSGDHVGTGYRKRRGITTEYTTVRQSGSPGFAQPAASLSSREGEAN